MKYSPLQLPKIIEERLLTLHQNHQEAYLVGGAVRDLLLGRTPHDYDIATDASLSSLPSLFPNTSFFQASSNHDILTAKDENMMIDFTHYEELCILDDLKHRDFTINALAYSQEYGLIDPFDGHFDIRQGIIRIVNQDSERIKEDPIRILRAIRLATMLHFRLDPISEQILFQNKEALAHVAPERIQLELSKFLELPHAGRYLRTYVELFEIIIPEISKMKGFEQHNPYHIYDVYEHTIRVIEQVPNRLSLKLAALFHDAGKPITYTQDEKGIGHFYGHPDVSVNLAKARLTALRYDEKTIRQVVHLITYHDYPLAPEKKRLKKFLFRFGAEDLDLLFALKKADLLAQNPEHQGRMETLEQSEAMIQEILQSGECVSYQQLAIRGDDLLSLGIPQGKQVGLLLEYLLHLVMRDSIKNEKKQLIQAAKEHWNHHKG